MAERDLNHNDEFDNDYESDFKNDNMKNKLIAECVEKLRKDFNASDEEIKEILNDALRNN